MRYINNEDYEEICRVVQMYVDGCAQGSGELMKPAFAESATINGAPIQVLFDDVTKAGPTDSTDHIDVLEVIGNIAVVRVILTDYHGSTYIDYHTLLKGEGGWKIMAKVFTEA